MLSLSNKSRIFLYNMHLALFVQKDDTNYPHKRIGKYQIGTSFVSKSTTVASPLADQTTSRIVAELERMRGTPLEKRFAISCYRDDVIKELRKVFACYRLKSSLALIPFLLDRLLVMEAKCYLFHTLPT